MKKLARMLCIWFGAGLSPKAPGTMGSLAALPFAYVIQLEGGHRALFAAAIIVFFVGWWAANVYMGEDRNRDPKEIVIDEVAGMWLLLSAMNGPTWQGYAIGFAIFRLFDIVKPWPISWADRNIKGGLGVMLDDILAALYPLLLLFIFFEALALYYPMV